MPDTREHMRRRVRAVGEYGSEDTAGGRCGPGDGVRVDGVDCALQGHPYLVPVRVRGRQCAHESVEGPHVVQQVPDVVVAYDEVRSQQAVQRRVPGGDGIAVVDSAAGGRVDVRVGGGFDEEADGFAAAGGGRDGNGAGVRMQAVQRDAVFVVDEALRLVAAGTGGVGTEVDEGFDAAAHPPLRNARAGPEPCRRPGAAPGLPHRERRVVGTQRDADGYRFPGDVPGADVHGQSLRIQRGVEPFAEKCGYALFAGLSPVMHRQPFLSGQ